MQPLKCFGALGKLCLCRTVVWLITQAGSPQKGGKVCTPPHGRAFHVPRGVYCWADTNHHISGRKYFMYFITLALMKFGICTSTIYICIHTMLYTCIPIIVYKYTQRRIAILLMWASGSSASQRGKKQSFWYCAWGPSQR